MLGNKMKRSAIDTRQFESADEQAKDRLKHQRLLEEYLELQKEFVSKKRKLQLAEQRRDILLDEVRFLRQRYRYLSLLQSQQLKTKQDSFQMQDLPIKSKMLPEKEVYGPNKTSVKDNPTLVGEEKYQRNKKPPRAAKKPKNFPMNGTQVGKKSISWQDHVVLEGL